MKKTIHPFLVAIVVIIVTLIIAMVFPTQRIGTVTNVVEYEEPIYIPFEAKETVESQPSLILPSEVAGESCVNWYSDYRVYPTGEITTTVGGEEIDIDFLAKLLYCEARGMNWEGQVYTCSAILNFCNVEKRSLWDAGHDKSCFEPAPYVDDAKPTKTQYEVIDWVINGGRIEKICYFRSGGKYHDFGTPVCEVDGHYFSKR